MLSFPTTRTKVSGSVAVCSTCCTWVVDREFFKTFITTLLTALRGFLTVSDNFVFTPPRTKFVKEVTRHLKKFEKEDLLGGASKLLDELRISPGEYLGDRKVADRALLPKFDR